MPRAQLHHQPSLCTIAAAAAADVEGLLVLPLFLALFDVGAAAGAASMYHAFRSFQEAVTNRC